jgi:magnesium-protoporphyrin O-methyltransferase
MARYDARRYRRRGLPLTARGLVEAAGDVAGASVLDVGGGVGALGLELLERGASRATTVELSAGYDASAEALLAEHRLADRAERRVGDFVVEADLVEPHDVVVLHRVVCCYPDAERLLAAAAGHAHRRLLLTYPRERSLTRLGARAVNLWLRLTRCGFRTYVHPVEAMVETARREGLSLARREPQGLAWENAVFERLPPAAGGNEPAMEPQHRESEPEERAAERAADATEETRDRRGDDDVRIEDDEAAEHRPPLDDADTQL